MRCFLAAFHIGSASVLIAVLSGLSLGPVAMSCGTPTLALAFSVEVAVVACAWLESFPFCKTKETRCLTFGATGFGIDSDELREDSVLLLFLSLELSGIAGAETVWLKGTWGGTIGSSLSFAQLL